MDYPSNRQTKKAAQVAVRAAKVLSEQVKEHGLLLEFLSEPGLRGLWNRLRFFFRGVR